MLHLSESQFQEGEGREKTSKTQGGPHSESNYGRVEMVVESERLKGKIVPTHLVSDPRTLDTVRTNLN